MIQVRRIENPKGVWRSAGNSDNFHVTLMRLPYDDAEDFKPFNSEGAWSATIVEGGDDFITLRSTVEGSGSDNAQQTGVKSIEGAGEHPIDFWIDLRVQLRKTLLPVALSYVCAITITLANMIFMYVKVMLLSLLTGMRKVIKPGMGII